MSDSPALPVASGGKLIVLSGPSGVGKSTIVKRLLAEFPERLRLSVSATTRSPRPGERDGVDYHFVSREEFAERRANGEFLEAFEVFGRGDWYGTLRSEVAPSLSEGKWVLLEVDVAGAGEVVAHYPQAMTIFVRPSTLEVLRCRLEGRGTESPESLAKRLQTAESELARAGFYRHQVINDDIDAAVAEITAILTGEQPA